MNESTPQSHRAAPVAKSASPAMVGEPREDWFWDYDTQQFYEGPALAPPEHHPVSQPVPGPQGRVPSDWQRHLH
jgi:hypothetical protein